MLQEGAGAGDSGVGKGAGFRRQFGCRRGLQAGAGVQERVRGVGCGREALTTGGSWPAVQQGSGCLLACHSPMLLPEVAGC